MYEKWRSHPVLSQCLLSAFFAALCLSFQFLFQKLSIGSILFSFSNCISHRNVSRGKRKSMNNSEQFFESFKKQKLHISLLTCSHRTWNLQKSHCNFWSKTIWNIWKYCWVHSIKKKKIQTQFSKTVFHEKIRSLNTGYVLLKHETQHIFPKIILAIKCDYFYL